MFSRKDLGGPTCPTCGYPVPVWKGDPDGEKLLEKALQFVRANGTSSTARVAVAIGRKKGFTYSLLSTLYRQGEVRPILQPDASGVRTRLWIPLVEDGKET
jgi:hypothetical protein